MTKKRAEQQGLDRGVDFNFFLEREPLLSKISLDPTVGSLWDKKESFSTRSGLRVDTGFEDF